MKRKILLFSSSLRVSEREKRASNPFNFAINYSKLNKKDSKLASARARNG
jgi:hypothetical protein